MQNYILLTQKIPTFLYTYYFKSWNNYYYFYLQFEGENKLNSKILVNLLRKIYVSIRVLSFYIMIHITTMAYIYVQRSPDGYYKARH
jgi:hypothetical protein